LDWLEALVLGIIQGLTEFLPVSSSGHLELGKALLGIQTESGLAFTVAVHGATVLSILIVFYRDIVGLIRGLCRWEWNEEARFLVKIGLSMLPVLLVGIFLTDAVESLFTGRVILVGGMLLVTGGLLAVAGMVPAGDKNLPYGHSLLIGLAQALAVIPGISRSGATISTGLILGNQRERVARFSFLMVLLPIIGANLRDLLSGNLTAQSDIGMLPLLTGFLAALVSGLLACRWMLYLVKKGKLLFFAFYCFAVGATALFTGITAAG